MTKSEINFDWPTLIVTKLFSWGFTALIFAASLIIMFLGLGWIDMTLFNWFVSPYFHIANISLTMVLGFTLFVRLQTSDWHPEIKQDNKWYETRIINIVFSHLLSLAVGYIIHRWFIH